MLRTAPVLFESSANNTNAKPVPSTPSSASALRAGHENVERVAPHIPSGNEITHATSSTCNINVAGL